MRLAIAIFLFFGVGSLIGFIFSTYHNVNYLSTAKETLAMVVELDRSRDSQGHVVYYPVFEYVTQQGDTLDYYSEQSSDNYKVGDTTMLLVGADGSIQDTRLFWTAPLVTGVLGLVFTTAGLGFWYSQYRQKKKKEYLLQYGRKITAKVIQLDYNRSIQVNGKSPQIVICESDISGQKVVMRSHNKWGQLHLSPGDEVEVYLDPKDHKKYWVNAD